jgi:pyruvate dehydrogenase E1 component
MAGQRIGGYHRTDMEQPIREIFDQFKQQLPDIDPVETREWLDSLDDVVEAGGTDRARYLIYKLRKRARQLQVGLPSLTQTR